MWNDVETTQDLPCCSQICDTGTFSSKCCRKIATFCSAENVLRFVMNISFPNKSNKNSGNVQFRLKRYTVINYDIPWNPTRVIQRLGRINRIGQKVFDSLQIYNLFPTETGEDVIKSKSIAEQKMFLIHNTLGEDCKIFDIDETPTASELYKRINANPEFQEEESLLTKIRLKLNDIYQKHPEVIQRIESLPNRIKTAKAYKDYNLVVFRRKSLGLFIQVAVKNGDNDTEVKDLLIDEAFPFIECDVDAQRLNLSDTFWVNYEKNKDYRKNYSVAKNEISNEVKAINNLKTGLKLYKIELEKYLPFIRSLLKDLRDYHTISKYSIRRLAVLDLHPNKPQELKRLIDEIEYLKKTFGADYLDLILKRIDDCKDEIIIAVENQT